MQNRQALTDRRTASIFSDAQASFYPGLGSQVQEVASTRCKARSVVRNASGEVKYLGQLEQLPVTESFQCISYTKSGTKRLHSHPNTATKVKRRQHVRALKTAHQAGRAGLASKDTKAPLQTKSACSECRRRKQRCSGERPTCQFCDSRELACSYEVANGLTRGEDLKRKLREATRQADDLDKIFKAMQYGTSEESIMLLAKLRLGASVEELLSTAMEVQNPSFIADFENPQKNQYRPSSEGAVEARTTKLI